MRKPSADAALVGALLAAIVVAALPAWTGEWIYDDWIMRTLDTMDDWHDAAQVFSRSSADYVSRDNAVHVGAVTYRPLSMLSLIVVQLGFPDAPLPHHLLSLFLHGANTLLLFWTLRATGGALRAGLAAVLFGLHPLGIEAYGWINGRSDVLAAFGVLVSAYALFAAAPRGRRSLLVVGTLLAAFSKETALVAVMGLAVASLLPAQRAAPQVRPMAERMRLAAICLTSVAVAVAGRALALGDAPQGGLSLRALPDLPHGLARLLAVSVQSVVVPLPRTMANLGFLLAEPLNVATLATLMAALAVLGVLAYQGAYRACALVATAGAMVFPCVVVRHMFWLGLDRYLYIPLALLCLALGSISLRVGLDTLRPRTAALLTASCGLLLGLATYQTAETYHSQTDHMLAMMRMRPDDPTGYLIGVRWLSSHGQEPGALQLLERMPRKELAPALGMELASVLGKVGKVTEGLEVVADVEQRFPNDPFVLLNVAWVRLDEGRIMEVRRLAERLHSLAGFCRAVRAAVESHLEQPAFLQKFGGEARDMLADYRCE